MKMRYGLLFILFITVPSLTLSMEKTSPPQTVKSAYIKTAKVRKLDGIVEAINKSTLSAQVSGRVNKIYFDVDDYVEEGDIVIRIRDNEYKARLQEAKASLNEAKALLKDAQLELNRVKGLFKDNMVSQADFDKATANVKASEARVAASKARITEAQEQLNNTIIRAPFSGVVVERHIEIGETTRIGQPLITGFALNQLRVSTDVPQVFINAVRKHKKATISVPGSLQKYQIDANNLTIFPFANVQSHTFRVRTSLPVNVKSLYPGMLVKVAFKIDESARLLIPTRSIVHRSEVTAIYVIDENNKPSLRQVRLGDQFDNNTEVLAGLDANENVAIDPVKAGVYLKNLETGK